LNMSKGANTSCKEAISRWIASDPENNKPSESELVSLICQIPPLKKMDNKLNDLTACTRLSLSTNVIDRIQPLPGLKKLKILSLGRNLIKKVEKLDDVKDSLEELWISYNNIEKLDGFANLHNLKVLYMSNNHVHKFDELLKLVELPNLQELLLVGNPAYIKLMEEATNKEIGLQHCRYEVINRLPKLKKLDGCIIKEVEREAAAAYAAGE